MASLPKLRSTQKAVRRDQLQIDGKKADAFLQVFDQYLSEGDGERPTVPRIGVPQTERVLPAGPNAAKSTRARALVSAAYEAAVDAAADEELAGAYEEGPSQSPPEGWSVKDVLRDKIVELEGGRASPPLPPKRPQMTGEPDDLIAGVIAGRERIKTGLGDLQELRGRIEAHDMIEERRRTYQKIMRRALKDGDVSKVEYNKIVSGLESPQNVLDFRRSKYYEAEIKRRGIDPATGEFIGPEGMGL